jgi:cytochrome c-type biogenesis protein CcmH
VKRLAVAALVLLALGTMLLAQPARAEAPRWAADRGETASEEEQLSLGEDVAVTVGAPAGPARTGAELMATTEFLAGQIRCPVCQGQSVQASTSEAARNMKQQIKALVAAGYSDDQVLRYFETSYGQFIRMMPRAEGFNLLVWIIPALALLIGAGFTWSVIRRLGRREETAPTEAEGEGSAGAPEPAVDPEGLEPWLQKVREELEAGHG